MIQFSFRKILIKNKKLKPVICNWSRAPFWRWTELPVSGQGLDVLSLRCLSAKLPRHILSGHCHSGCHSPKPRLSRAGTPAAPPLAAVPRSVCCMEVAACRWRRAHGLSLSSFVEVWGSRDKGIERMDVIRRTFIGGFFWGFFLAVCNPCVHLPFR